MLRSSTVHRLGRLTLILVCACGGGDRRQVSPDESDYFKSVYGDLWCVHERVCDEQADCDRWTWNIQRHSGGDVCWVFDPDMSECLDSLRDWELAPVCMEQGLWELPGCSDVLECKNFE